jgi:hypothetical protein
METIISIILCTLGIASYFLNRYANRKDKVKEPTLIFWWKDNWPELVQILLFTFSGMIIILMPGTTISIDSALNNLIHKLPEWAQIDVMAPSKPIISFIWGLGGSALVYFLFRKKSKKVEEENI